MKTDLFRRLFKLLSKPRAKEAAVGALICAAVLAAVLVFRALGWLRQPELIVYDRFVRSRLLESKDKRDDVIRIVGMTEDDLKKYGFPISDDHLLEVLTKIRAQHPCVVGLDMYRDLPEPRIRSGTKDEAADQARYEKFGEALKAMDNLVVITRVGFVDPPAVMKGTDQVVANNFTLDSVDGMYRRAPLWVKRGEDDFIPSLSMYLALQYWTAHGGDFEQKEVDVDGRHYQQFRLGRTTFPWMGPDAGGYVGLGQRDYEYLIDYEQPLNFLHRSATPTDPLGQAARDTPYDYSFGEILEGLPSFPPDALKDKIVLVATVMQSIKDSNPTPIHDNFRGVQMHAVLVRQLLDAAAAGRAPMAWWPEWGEVLWIAGWTLLGGMLGLMLRSPTKFVPALFVGLAAMGFAAKFSFGHGVWILLAAPALGFGVAAVLVISYMVALERASRRTVQSLFAKHVSKKVANALLEQSHQFLAGGRMPPRAFTGTVIFTDLVGFSTASEKLSAEQTMRWLNEYMDVMAEIVERFEGTVNKYIGDAIMGVFGAPIVHQDDVGIDADAVRAVRCALFMRHEVPVLNARWKETMPEIPPIAMRVGIFTGPLVDGSFGSAERLEWTVIGDTVNRANRLESAGKEIKDQLSDEEKCCSILIGPEVFNRVGHHFETVPVPDMPLKGISERVTVYRVLSERASATVFKPSKP